MKTVRAFPPDVDSIPEARRFVLAAIGAVTQDLRDAVSVMVSELAMNAVQHARTPFEVTVEVTGRVLRVEVADSGGGTAQAQPLPPATSPHGRGLFIVDRLSDAWGVSPTPPGVSKNIWFTIELNAATESFHRQAAATEPQPPAGTPAQRSPDPRMHRPQPERAGRLDEGPATSRHCQCGAAPSGYSKLCYRPRCSGRASAGIRQRGSRHDHPACSAPRPDPWRARVRDPRAVVDRSDRPGDLAAGIPGPGRRRALTRALVPLVTRAMADLAALLQAVRTLAEGDWHHRSHVATGDEHYPGERRFRVSRRAAQTTG